MAAYLRRRLSAPFGFGMMLAPGAGALALVLVIGIDAVITGVVLVALVLRLSKHAHADDVPGTTDGLEDVGGAAAPSGRTKEGPSPIAEFFRPQR